MFSPSINFLKKFSGCGAVGSGELAEKSGARGDIRGYVFAVFQYFTACRVEIACPIRSPEIRRRLHEILDAMLADSVKARVLLPDGTYTKKPPAYEPVCAQVLLMKRAVEAAQQQSAAAPQEKRSLWEKLFHRKGR